MSTPRGAGQNDNAPAKRSRTGPFLTVRGGASLGAFGPAHIDSMSIRIRSVVIAAAVLFSVLAHPAAAQTSEELAYSLGAASPLVLTGRVAALESRWDTSAGAIYTYVTVSVTERLKGELAESMIVIKQIGGQIGNIGLFVGDQPTYSLDEEVLVFLAVRPRDGTLYPAGFALGKWRLDTSTGDARAMPPAAATREIGRAHV